MDVVLDVLDTFAFDRLYATLLPATQAQLALNKDLLPTYNQNIGNYISLSPSTWAVRSSWLRDDVKRQALSLFFITWCVHHDPNKSHSANSMPMATGSSVWSFTS